MNQDIIAIIPARGGSKGVPRKNIKLLVDKPLIAYTIEAAKKSKYLTRTLVSTEDEEIKKIALRWGAEVINRPEELARDEVLTIDVLFHVFDYLKSAESVEPNLVVVLQPTSPLRTVDDIDESIKLFLSSNNALSLVSVTEYEKTPFWALKLSNRFVLPMFDEKYFKMRRQDIPPAYKPNGAVFISKPEVLRKYKTFYTPRTLGYIMPPERSIDIDTEFDFMFAEFLLGRQRRAKGGENKK